MCVNCVRSQVDITESIPREVIIHQCRGCGRYQRPPWVNVQLESREMLGLCLKKLSLPLSKLHLVEAGFIWTEPHSRRLKVKLTVEKEVMNSLKLQQELLVVFVVRNQQCEDCTRSFTEHSWTALVQTRQKVDHKRTFLYLEQLILKHNAHSHASNIEQVTNGMDFSFMERNAAAKFVDFLQTVVPCRFKQAKQLVSEDLQSNLKKYKFTYAVEIAPVCKDEVVCLPKGLATTLGNISQLVLVYRVTNAIFFVDPLTVQTAELTSDRYWKEPFRGMLTAKRLIEFTVLDIKPVEQPIAQVQAITRRKMHGKRGARRAAVGAEGDADFDTESKVSRGSKQKFSGMSSATSTVSGGPKGKFLLAEAEVVRSRDFGVNETSFFVKTHMGNVLQPGDTVMGYDLSTAIFNDADAEGFAPTDYPDVILVRKCYPRREGKSRNWKLRRLAVGAAEHEGKRDAERDETDTEAFLRDLEEDPLMRRAVNMYRDKSVAAADTIAEGDEEAGDEDEDGEAAPTVPLDSLLEDMTLADADADPDSDEDEDDDEAGATAGARGAAAGAARGALAFDDDEDDEDED